MGNTGYIRQRDLEFSQKNVPREELIREVGAVMTVVEETLSVLTEADLQKEIQASCF